MGVQPLPAATTLPWAAPVAGAPAALEAGVHPVAIYLGLVGAAAEDLQRLRPIPTGCFIDGAGVIRHIEYGVMTEAAIGAVFDRLLQHNDAG